MIITLGKLMFAAIWGLMFYNLICPLPSPANVFINIALLIFIITHGLQTWLLSKTLTSKEKNSAILIKMFFFGAFEALSWKK